MTKISRKPRKKETKIRVRQKRGPMKTKDTFKPTRQEREAVNLMTAVGITQIDVARVTRNGIDVKTLRKHFREEIDTAAIKANARIGGAMFNKALNGDVSAMKYWLGARAGWKDDKQEQVNNNLFVLGGDDGTNIDELRESLRDRIAATTPTLIEGEVSKKS